MSSITAKQTKLDLELVPKENRLDIEKCNGGIPRGLTPREPTFQVVLDAIALTPCYPAFLITTDVPEICPKVRGRDFDLVPSEEDIVSFLRELGHTVEINSLNDVVVDQMHQPWRNFAALINRGLSGKTSGLDKLRLSRAQILWGMFYQKNVDYVESLWEDFVYQIENRVYKKQEKMYYPRFTKAIIHHFLIQEKSLSWRKKISPAMKESKAYNTYLVYATGVVPPKMARKFKNASPFKKDSDLVLIDEETVTKGKRVNRPAKKSTTKPAAGVVIREAPIETKSKSKEKEKVDVTHGKGIELLSETHPSGSGTVAKKPQSVDKIIPTVTSEGTGDKPGVPDVTEDDSTESESETWGNDEDDINNDQDLSNEDNEQENESEENVSDSEQEEESKDDDQEAKDDEESDDMIKGDKEIVQGEGADAEMIDAQQGNENLETTQEKVVEDAHVIISTITKKIEVPVTSSSRASDLASKFLNFLDIPHDRSHES
ncbi:hypothetical protein Tco_0060116 [Tanacetum coccineum]